MEEFDFDTAFAAIDENLELVGINLSLAKDALGY
jgi:hypothetical protein